MRRVNLLCAQLRGAATTFGWILLSLFTVYGCASQKPQLTASQYRFDFENETYRVRSISSEDGTESYNELIGKNFLAADFDQDRVIDSILLGEVNLSEAQRVYEFGLEKVAQEDKLHVRIPSVNRYVYEGYESYLEISSFRPPNAQPFNEFKITDKRQMVSPRIIVLVDQNADGTLDEILKGQVTLEEIQPQYAEAIEVGLAKRALIKTDGTILVKEK